MMEKKADGFWGVSLVSLPKTNITPEKSGFPEGGGGDSEMLC